MTRVAKRDVLLRGTLDMLILRTLQWGPTHGHDIAKHIQRRTDDVLQVAAWLALSRPPSASPERLDLFQLGDAQNAQPRILVLPPDRRRTAAADCRGATVAAPVEGDRQRDVAADGGMT